MKVAVVAHFYPRAADPVFGIWAHRQALAARDAGAEVRVLVLHRPVPPLAEVRAGPRRAVAAARTALAQPRRTLLDGLDVRYVPFLAPPQAGSYQRWGAWAAPTLAVALRRLRREFPFDLVHAHYAVPTGDAVVRSRIDAPLVVSVHGGDVLATSARGADARATVERTFAAARLVLANSVATESLCREHGARRTRVVHLGADVPKRPARPPDAPVLVTVAHLVARKRHADVLRALALLAPSRPNLTWRVVGDGPERPALEALAAELGVADRVTFLGSLPHAEAVAEAQAATAFVLPSVDEAFGVGYIEAMAAGVPAVGCRGEGGPEEIAGAGGGIVLVPPADVEGLCHALEGLIDDHAHHRELAARARATVARRFTWERCGEATVAAYEEALA